jgi:hypothetical protein
MSFRMFDSRENVIQISKKANENLFIGAAISSDGLSCLKGLSHEMG